MACAWDLGQSGSETLLNGYGALRAFWGSERGRVRSSQPSWGDGVDMSEEPDAGCVCSELNQAAAGSEKAEDGSCDSWNGLAWGVRGRHVCVACVRLSGWLNRQNAREQWE